MLAGVLLWSFLLDAITRALPQNWRIPEAMAKRTLGASSPWEAGSHLMRTANPRAWAALNEASDLHRDNHETIEKCREAAAQTSKPIRCAGVETISSVTRRMDDLPRRESVLVRK